MKADRTWHYFYYDFIDKNRKVEIILSLINNRFFKSTLSYLFNASLHANKASKNTFKNGNVLSFVLLLIILAEENFTTSINIVSNYSID